jgi:hypothetical protein
MPTCADISRSNIHRVYTSSVLPQSSFLDLAFESEILYYPAFLWFTLIAGTHGNYFVVFARVY